MIKSSGCPHQNVPIYLIINIIFQRVNILLLLTATLRPQFGLSSKKFNVNQIAVLILKCFSLIHLDMDLANSRLSQIYTLQLEIKRKIQ